LKLANESIQEIDLEESVKPSPLKNHIPLGREETITIPMVNKEEIMNRIKLARGTF
jgi:hypothetical protein